ncbi:MAG: hypothetical protein HRT45_06760 [Bdellovibrionales bacterium]|nr:hypothetical protein [Bdellovibrionales bacterium]
MPSRILIAQFLRKCFRLKLTHLILLPSLPIVMSACGDFTSTSKSDSSQRKPAFADPSDETIDLEDSNLRFKAGDPFDPSLVPLVISEDFRNLLNDYVSDPSPYKAVAMAPTGVGTAIGLSSNRVDSQDEANRVILERCHLIARQPCSLLAEGNLFVKNEDQFFLSQGSILTTPELFDASLLPGVTEATKARVAASFANAVGLFLVVIANTNGRVALGSSDASYSDAHRRAAEIFETMWDEPHFVYSLGSEVIFDVENYQLEDKSLRYGPREINVEEVPFADAFVREQIADAYQRADNGGTHLIITLSWKGHAYLLESEEPITREQEIEALEECQDSVDLSSGNYNCFVYAIDKQVVMTRDQLIDASLP